MNANPAKDALAVVARMRLFFVGTGLKSADRRTVEKWARELETALKKEKDA